jgi:hypothetical protein
MADSARHVAAVARVNLDDFGALVCEEHGAERTRAVLLEREYAHAGEREHFQAG